MSRHRRPPSRWNQHHRTRSTGGPREASEVLSDEEKITLHQRYKDGELSDDVAEILLGDAIDEIEREREALEEATELDTGGVFQE